MPLSEIDTLDDTLAQAQAEGMAPERQLELIDFWRDKSMDAAQVDFAAPEAWKENQQFHSFLDEQVIKAKDPLMAQVSTNTLKNYFKEDTTAMKDFMDEFQEKQDKYTSYSNVEYTNIAKDLIGKFDSANKPSNRSPLKTSVTDGKGNELANIAVSYDENGKARYANVFVNGQEGEGIQNGDVIKLPKDFDGYQYLKDKKKAEVSKLQDQLFGLSEEDLANSVAVGEKLEIATKELEILEGSGAPKALRSLNAEGVDAYVKDTIESKVKLGDPKYAAMGQGMVDGAWQTTQNVLTQMYQGARANTASIIKEMNKALLATAEAGREVSPEERADFDQQQQHFQDVIEDATYATENASRKQTFSRLSVTDSALAKNIENVTNAVGQGGAIAAQFALLGPVGGYTSTYMQAAGGKITELSMMAEDLRTKGDAESADWLDANKFWVGQRSGAYELLIEKLFPGHDPARQIMKTGVREAAQGFAKDFTQESLEGGLSAVAGALDDYITGITDRAGFESAIGDVPEQALLEGIGVSIPAGARAVVVSMMKESALRGSAAANAKTAQTPPTDPSKVDTTLPVGVPEEVNQEIANRAADKETEQGLAAQSVTDTVDGQPGDTGQVVVGEPTLPKGRKYKDVEGYLRSIYDKALQEIRLRGGPDEVAFPISSNQQEQEIEDAATVFHSYVAGTPRTFEESRWFSDVQANLQQDPEYQKLTPDQQEKFLNQYAFKGYPPFQVMSRKGVVVGDLAGRVRLMSNSQLLKKIEKGEIDPNHHYFYLDQTADDDDDSVILRSVLPESRIVGGVSGAPSRKKADGTTTPSKGNEQVMLQGSGYELETSTIGGKSLHPKEPLAKLDDELADGDITSETREGEITELSDTMYQHSVKKMTGRFLTKQGEAKLIENLNAKYGKNNWLLKMDGGAQKVGLVVPWIKGSLSEDGKTFAHDIPVMPEAMYVAQKRVENKADYRISVRVNKDGTMGIVPFGIHGGRANHRVVNLARNATMFERTEDKPEEETMRQSLWTSLPLLTVSKDFRNKVDKMLRKLEKTGLAASRDTVYGLDVIEDNDGNLKIIEANPADDEGESGGHTYFGSAMSGLFSLMRKGYSAEAMTVYAALQKAKGQTAIADKIFEKAVRRLGGDNEDIPDSRELYEKGTFFSSIPNNLIAKAEREGRNAPLMFANMDTLRDLQLPELTAVQKQIQTHPETFENYPNVGDLLHGIAESRHPIDSGVRKLAKVLLDTAVMSQNDGLDSIVVLGEKNKYQDIARAVVLNNQRIQMAGLDPAMHEAVHALTVHQLPSYLDLYGIPFENAISGTEYLSRLHRYLADPKANPYLKYVIEDYLDATKALGEYDFIFDPERKLSVRSIREISDSSHYGLSTLSEFITETLTTPTFARELMRIVPTETDRFYLRKLLNSVMEWVKSTIIPKGSAVKNLFDRSYSDIMMFIASASVPESRWESEAISAKNFTTMDQDGRIPDPAQVSVTETERGAAPEPLLPEAEVNKRLKLFNDAVGEVMSRTTYGTRTVTAPKNAKFLIWSNGASSWTLDVSGLRKGKKEVTLDANVIAISAPTEKIAKELAQHLPPLPLDKFSNERDPVIGALGKLSPNDKIFKQLGIDTDEFFKQPDAVQAFGNYINFLHSKTETERGAEPPSNDLSKIKSFIADISKEDKYGKFRRTADNYKKLPKKIAEDLQDWATFWVKPGQSYKTQLYSYAKTDDAVFIRSDSEYTAFNPETQAFATLESMGEMRGRSADISPGQRVPLPEGMIMIEKSYNTQGKPTYTIIANTGKALTDSEPVAKPYRVNQKSATWQYTLPETGEVKLDDVYEVMMPGTKVHGTTIMVPHGTPHEGIMKVINERAKKFDDDIERFGDPSDHTQNVQGHNINPSFLTPNERAQLGEIQNEDIPTPSEITDPILSNMAKSSEQAEFQLLKQAYPHAFSSKNPYWKGFTTLQEAELTLADWLYENSKELKAFSVGGPNKQQDSKYRVKLVRQAKKHFKELKKRTEKGDLTNYNEYTDSLKEQINKVIDWILNGPSPKDMTNRELLAINLTLKNFLKSDGAVVRGFAVPFKHLYISQEGDRLDNLKTQLMADGITEPWGDPIDDRRRNFVKESKTGSSMADFATETLAIFNRPKSKKVFAAMYAPYRSGLNAAKALYNEFSEVYSKAFSKLGSTTLLQDTRIGMASFLTQCRVLGDSLSDIQTLFEQANESITRREKSTAKIDKRLAPIERAAWNDIARPIFAQVQAGVLTADDIIDFVENQLTDQEFQYLSTIRIPGQQFFNQLNGINQMARGEPLEQHRNYVKRVQHQLNGEKMTNTWGEKAMQTPDSILQPREGLGKASVFDFNFRNSFDWQLQETAYELNTGIERIALFNFLNSKRFENAMDGDVSNTPRSRRMRNQIGGVHANYKNKEISFGILAGTFLEVYRYGVATQLVTLKAVANQLIPFFNMFFSGKYTQTMTDVFFHRVTNMQYRKNSNNMLKELNPDLKNRIDKWDNLIEGLKIAERFKKSGMPQSAIKSVTENLLTGGKRMGHFAKTIFQSPYGFGLPITITNGLSEVFSANTVFFTLYIDKLIENGVIQNAEQFFQSALPINDPLSLSEAELDFDSFVLTPIQPEFRSEFSQRNSGGKVAANILVNALLRTATQQGLKSVTALRDLYHATKEHYNVRNNNSAEFLKSASFETYKQMLSIALYYGIAKLFLKGVGTMATATTFVNEAALQGEWDDRDYWMRRLQALEKLNREEQANFVAQQGYVDMLYFGIPFPAFLQNNGMRSIFTSMFQKASFDNVTSEEYDIDLDKLRTQRKKIRKELNAAIEVGVNESAINTLNKSLELLDYTIAKTERAKENKEKFVKNSRDRFIEGISTSNIFDNELLETARTFTPEWAENFLYSNAEKTREQKKIMDQAQSSSAWWALAGYLNLNEPSMKAARQVLKEFSSKKIEDAATRKKQTELILEKINE